jgi:hypothetical protein
VDEADGVDGADGADDGRSRIDIEKRRGISI